MNYQLDVIGSVIVAGAILLNMAVFLTDDSKLKRETADTIEAVPSLTEIAHVMRDDLSAVGDGVQDAAILRATPTLFSFRRDIANDGVIDTVTYVHTNAVDHNGFPEVPPGRLLRIVNGQVEWRELDGIVGFAFTYIPSDTVQEATRTMSGSVSGVGVHIRMKQHLANGGDCQYSSMNFEVRLPLPGK
jgi:hypothetical protein